MSSPKVYYDRLKRFVGTDIEHWARQGTGVGSRAPAGAASLTRRQKSQRCGGAIFGVLLIFLSGFFLMYHVFFKDVRLDDIGDVEGGRAVDFRYDGVAYFHGYALESGERWTVSYDAPWVLALSEATIEVYVEVPEAIGQSADDSVAGTLRIEQGGDDLRVQLPIAGQRLQRLRVDWAVEPCARNQLSVRYDAEAAEHFRTVHVAFRVTQFSVLWPAAGLFLAGTALTLVAVSFGRSGRESRRARGRVLVLLALGVFAYYVHSGAFTSNDFFGPGHHKVPGLAAELAEVLEHGHMSQQVYRDAGAALVPAIVGVLEAGNPVFEYFPSSRYVIFALFVGASLFLAQSLGTLIGWPVAYTFFMIAVIYFPFAIDLYFPDVDAMFLFLFPAFLAFLVRARYGHGPFWLHIGGLVAVFFVMGMTKVTPAFLVLLAPLVFLLPRVPPWRRQAIVAGLVALALLTVFQGGRIAAAALHHPERHVGIEGEPFQDTVFWHIIWAAYGYYDDYSAHWFTKSGRLRRERVAERTGLPDKGYVHQSQTATEEVYKPDVLRAVREAPGFFYSTAFLRFYNNGLRLFRYSYGFQGWRHNWLEDHTRTAAAISGEEVALLTPERRAIRYDEAWKFSPLVLLLKLTQGDITRMWDLVLLSLAFLGLLAIRQPGLAAFLVACGLAQIAFASLIHVPDRYVLFCSYAWLIGLSMALCRLVSLITVAPGRVHAQA